MTDSLNDQQIVRTATGFRRGMLGRDKSDFMCFAICAPLASLLRASGTPAELREGWIEFGVGRLNHYWIELSDGRVLDPTGDQFNGRPWFQGKMPKVYLGKPDPTLHPRGDGESVTKTSTGE